VGTVKVEREPTPLGPDHPITADALSRAVHATLEAEDPSRLHGVLVDLSGERWRFLEWALAETRFSMRLPAGWRLWHPADCIGDVGAATGLVHVALAVRAFARDYAGGGSVLVDNSPERCERFAACIHAACAEHRV